MMVVKENAQDLNATVQPHDAVSQAGRDAPDERADEETSADAHKAPGRVSVASSTTLTSSSRSRVSGAHVQAEVERAALLAKVQALQEKHALQLEELQLKARKEALALKTDLAVANAKSERFCCNQDQQTRERRSQTASSTEFIPPATIKKSVKSSMERTTKVSPISFKTSAMFLQLDNSTKQTSTLKSQKKSPGKSPVYFGYNAFAEIMGKQLNY